jgi:hypothetical protein
MMAIEMKAKLATGLLLLAALAPAPAAADCQCRANGTTYHHGEIACLKLPSGDQLARCDMVLNNSSWKKLSDGCPQASLARPQGPPLSLPASGSERGDALWGSAG